MEEDDDMALYGAPAPAGALNGVSIAVVSQNGALPMGGDDDTEFAALYGSAQDGGALSSLASLSKSPASGMSPPGPRDDDLLYPSPPQAPGAEVPPHEGEPPDLPAPAASSSAPAAGKAADAVVPSARAQAGNLGRLGNLAALASQPRGGLPGPGAPLPGAPAAAAGPAALPRASIPGLPGSAAGGVSAAASLYSGGMGFGSSGMGGPMGMGGASAPPSYMTPHGEAARLARGSAAPPSVTAAAAVAAPPGMGPGWTLADAAFPSTAAPGQPVKLPGQTRVSPEEYREFLSLGHGELFDIDIDCVVDAPWRMPGADPSDFFNFGLSEHGWKGYSLKVRQFRLEYAYKTAIPDLFATLALSEDISRGRKPASEGQVPHPPSRAALDSAYEAFVACERAGRGGGGRQGNPWDHILVLAGADLQWPEEEPPAAGVKEEEEQGPVKEGSAEREPSSTTGDAAPASQAAPRSRPGSALAQPPAPAPPKSPPPPPSVAAAAVAAMRAAEAGPSGQGGRGEGEGGALAALPLPLKARRGGEVAPGRTQEAARALPMPVRLAREGPESGSGRGEFPGPWREGGRRGREEEDWQRGRRRVDGEGRRRDEADGRRRSEADGRQRPETEERRSADRHRAPGEERRHSESGRREDLWRQDDLRRKEDEARPREQLFSDRPWDQPRSDRPWEQVPSDRRGGRRGEPAVDWGPDQGRDEGRGRAERDLRRQRDASREQARRREQDREGSGSKRRLPDDRRSSRSAERVDLRRPRR